MKKVLFHLINAIVGVILFISFWGVGMYEGFSGSHKYETIGDYLLICLIINLAIWVKGGWNIFKNKYIFKYKKFEWTYWFIYLGFLFYIFLELSGILPNIEQKITEKKQLAIFPNEIQQLYKTEDKSVYEMELPNSYTDTKKTKNENLIINYDFRAIKSPHGGYINPVRPSEIESQKAIQKKINIYKNLSLKLNRDISLTFQQGNTFFISKGKIKSCKKDINDKVNFCNKIK